MQAFREVPWMGASTEEIYIWLLVDMWDDERLDLSRIDCNRMSTEAIRPTAIQQIGFPVRSLRGCYGMRRKRRPAHRDWMPTKLLVGNLLPHLSPGCILSPNAAIRLPTLLQGHRKAIHFERTCLNGLDSGWIKFLSIGTVDTQPE